MASVDAEGRQKGQQGDYEQARSTKFRFKSKAHRKRNGDEESSHPGSKRRKERSFSRHTSSYSHHKRRRRSLPLEDQDATLEDGYFTDTYSHQQLDPDTAFRESLFDALADDEGAAFWEGVYGQPIHTYPNTKAGPDGDLERMSDEAYARYVRTRMWEKSDEYILEERRRREEQRKKQKVRDEHMEKEQAEREAFEEKIARALRKGERRKEKNRWQEAWESYVQRWQKFDEVVATKSKDEGSLSGKLSRGIIPWPVESGRWKDVQKEDVEDFFLNAPHDDDGSMAVLKAERVRWHPDKMQQRFGLNKLDDETVRTITAAFQVIDRLYTEHRGRAG